MKSKLSPKDTCEIIKALGGTSSTARLFGIKPPSVSEWKNDGMPLSRFIVLERRFKRLKPIKEVRAKVNYFFEAFN